jgi:hypothetical protein
VHGLHQTYHRLRNHFGRTQWYSLVMKLNWKLILVYLEIVLILTQDRCIVCAKHTIGSEKSFGHTRWNSWVTWVMWNLVSVHLEILLVSVQDRCTVYAKRTIGS